MVAAPIFGYLGDRFNRKVILSCGIFFWSIVTLSSSFIGKEVGAKGRRGLSYRRWNEVTPPAEADTHAAFVAALQWLHASLSVWLQPNGSPSSRRVSITIGLASFSFLLMATSGFDRPQSPLHVTLLCSSAAQQ